MSNWREIGKADIMANTSLPMAAFRRNVSFSAADVYHMCHSKDTINDVMRKVLDLTTNGFLTPPPPHTPPSPVETFSVSDIEAAFVSLQSGRSMGRNVYYSRPFRCCPSKPFQLILSGTVITDATPLETSTETRELDFESQCLLPNCWRSWWARSRNMFVVSRQRRQASNSTV